MTYLPPLYQLITTATKNHREFPKVFGLGGKIPDWPPKPLRFLKTLKVYDERDCLIFFAPNSVEENEENHYRFTQDS